MTATSIALYLLVVVSPLLCLMWHLYLPSSSGRTSLTYKSQSAVNLVVSSTVPSSLLHFSNCGSGAPWALQLMVPGFPLTRVCFSGVFIKSALSKFKEHFHCGFMVVRMALFGLTWVVNSITSLIKLRAYHYSLFPGSSVYHNGWYMLFSTLAGCLGCKKSPWRWI